MADAHPVPAELKALQDAIDRDKILRARAMTAEERFAEGFELSNSMRRRALEGAMWQLDTQDVRKGWAEVRRRFAVVSHIEDRGFFVNERPNAR